MVIAYGILIMLFAKDFLLVMIYPIPLIISVR